MSKSLEHIKNDPKSIRKIIKPMDSNIIGAGKLPPQAVDLEEAILGALMLEKGPLNDVIDTNFGNTEVAVLQANL